MAPPIRSLSANFSRFAITSILSETFAPPRMPTQGWAGLFVHFSR